MFVKVRIRLMKKPCKTSKAERSNVLIETNEVNIILNAAIDRYMIKRRERIPEFINRHFSFKGSLKLHRKALGWDMVRAPVNAALGLLSVVKLLISSALRLMKSNLLSDRITGLNLFLDTDLGKELTWRLHKDLLELPYQQQGRSCNKDELLMEIMRDPTLENRLLKTLEALAPHQHDPSFHKRLTEEMHTYVGSRAAASDITVSLMAAASGLAVMNKFTPGAFTLGTSLAGGFAYTTAVNSFWAGSRAGGIYYSLVGVSTPPWMIAGAFTGMLIPIAALGTFAGIVADPVQRKLGLHQKRLHNLLNTVEANLKGEGDVRLAVRDHYLARIFDFMDWTQAAIRFAA